MYDVKSYQEKYLSTMTSSELVTLMYGEIIKNLKKSVVAIEGGRLSQAHDHIIKAQDILIHLINNLDFKYKISTNLLYLYEFMYDTLVKANVSKDVEGINLVIGFVADLKNTWVEAEKQSRIISHNMEKCI
jgi:flagellar protein FliS